MARKKKEENLIVKPKLLITIVDRNKTEFYYDLIASLGSNMQIITHGEGTNNNQTFPHKEEKPHIICMALF